MSQKIFLYQFVYLNKCVFNQSNFFVFALLLTFSQRRLNQCRLTRCIPSAPRPPPAPPAQSAVLPHLWWVKFLSAPFTCTSENCKQQLCISSKAASDKNHWRLCLCVSASRGGKFRMFVPTMLHQQVLSSRKTLLFPVESSNSAPLQQRLLAKYPQKMLQP